MHDKTYVGIIGAGPAGLTLSLLLARQGIEWVIIENRSCDYIKARVRAGLLEQNTVNLLTELGVSDRLREEGLQHHGVYLSFNGTPGAVPVKSKKLFLLTLCLRPTGAKSPTKAASTSGPCWLIMVNW